MSAVFEALASRRADRAFCDGCHRPRGRDGLGCADCHGAVGNFGVRNGLLALDLDGPVRGPTGMAGDRAAHETAASDYLASADLCGTCHEVDGPGPFRESPYAHWRASTAAARGETCASCHLEEREEQPIADFDGLTARPGLIHRAVGPDDGAIAAPLYGRVPIAIVIEDGRRLVTIDNRSNGHAFPDGASFLRTVDVVIRTEGRTVRSIPLASELSGGPLPSDRARAVPRGVPAGEVMRVPIAEGDEVCLVVERYRADLLEALGLEAEAAGFTTCAEGPG
jgi:hypothetical protein